MPLKPKDDEGVTIKRGTGAPVTREPLQQEKIEIVDLIDNMSKSMTSFQCDIESRLEKSLVGLGGKDVAKKYGFEMPGAKNQNEFIHDDIMQQNTKAYNRKMLKMQS